MEPAKKASSSNPAAAALKPEPGGFDAGWGRFRFQHALLLWTIALAVFLMGARADAMPYGWSNFASSVGVGGTESAAQFSSPHGVAVDVNGNITIADTDNGTIRKVTPGGETTTLAGSPGVFGSSDSTGISAWFAAPGGVAVDGSGNVYVADTGNNTIRKVTPGGVVTTLAGNPGVSGTADGMKTGALFAAPGGVAVDGSGNVYVADTGNNTIRKVTPDGAVTTLAGSPKVSGTADGMGSAASFCVPAGVAVDGDGNVYVADSWNNTIRKVTPSGSVTTLAGTPGPGGSVDGTGSAARFNFPLGVAVDGSGNIYVADDNNYTVRKVTQGGVVTTLAGTPGNKGISDGTGTAAQFDWFGGIAVDGNGNVYVTDDNNHTIRKVTQGGVVTTLAGTPGNKGASNGTGTGAQFSGPAGVAVDRSGNVYIADTGRHAIRKVTFGGAVTTLAGSPELSGTADGTGGDAQFYEPRGIAVDGNGNVYVADAMNFTIRKITPEGAVTTLAGSPGVSGTADGTGSAARFSYPMGVAVEQGGNVYVADTENHTIRKITPEGTVTTLAGSPGVSGTADGTGRAARFYYPGGVAVDASGSVYVADTQNHTIRKITPEAAVTTLAGSPGLIGTSDGLVSEARFFCPGGVAVDESGNIYLGDAGVWSLKVSPSGWFNVIPRHIHTIRMVTPLGEVKTIGGVPAGDGMGTGPGFLTHLSGVAVSSSGILYAADPEKNLVSQGVKSVAIFSSNDDLGFTPGQSEAVISVLNNDTGAYGANLAITGVTQGSVGRVAINSNGTITYTPFKTYQGIDSFTYTVTDELGNTAITRVVVGDGFIAAKGSYAGLVTNGTPGNDNSGRITITLTGAGHFSGRLVMAGISYGVKGKFDADWYCLLSIARTHQTNLSLLLHLDPCNRQITGTVDDNATFVSDFTANRAPYLAKLSPAPQAGKFTVLLPPDPLTMGESAYPQGNGYLLLTVTAGGRVTAHGKLGDGSAIGAGGLLVNGSRIPVYAGLYGHKYPTCGGIFGNVSLNGLGTPVDSCSGTLTWFKPQQRTGNYYRSGFATTTQLIGSRYIPPTKGGSGALNGAFTGSLHAPTAGRNLVRSTFSGVLPKTNQ